MTEKFKKMYHETLKHEGVYSNNSEDKGGETCFGISRRYNQKWSGWEIVDDCKIKSQMVGDKLKKMLNSNQELHDRACSYYYINYYLYYGVDKIHDDLQPVIFDMCVNHSPKAVLKILKDALGTDILSIKKLKDYFTNKSLSKHFLDEVINNIVDARVRFVEQLVADDPSQKEFLRGWITRYLKFKRGVEL